MKPPFLIPQRLNLGLIGLILLVWVACSSADKSSLELVGQTVSANDWDIAGATHLLIIPSSGCGGCITAAEEVMLKCLPEKKQTVKFILTGFVSKKALKSRFGASVLANPAVFLDEQGVLFRQLPDPMYPKLIQVDAGNLTKMVEFSPGSIPDLDELED
jgi:hypothetical protein